MDELRYRITFQTSIETFSKEVTAIGQRDAVALACRLVGLPPKYVVKTQRIYRNYKGHR